MDNPTAAPHGGSIVYTKPTPEHEIAAAIDRLTTVFEQILVLIIAEFAKDEARAAAMQDQINYGAGDVRGRADRSAAPK